MKCLGVSAARKRGLRDWRPGGVSAAEARLKRGDLLSAAEMAIVVEQLPGDVLPDVVKCHLARLLRGEIKGKRGRKPRRSGSDHLRAESGPAIYARALEAFQYLHARSKRPAKSRRAAQSRPSEEAPHERARDYVEKRLGGKARALYDAMSRAGALPNKRPPRKR